MPKLMVKVDVIAAHDQVKSSGFFLDEDAIGFYEWHDWTAEKGLERLVFRVSRNPKYLKGHLERIYYCFENQLDLQLFGALTDLVIVLGENGGTLCRRMINGSRSRLTQENYQALIAKIENNKKIIKPLSPKSRISIPIRTSFFLTVFQFLLKAFWQLLF
jgi:hypothetical protein